MKSSFKYLACVSAVGFVLFGTACTKKEDPKPQAEAEVEVATPEVEERLSDAGEYTELVCQDDAYLKNRVVGLVRQELYGLSVAGLGKGATDELSQQLKARLSNIEIDLHNASEDKEKGECVAQLHIVLSNQEVAAANKTFKAAGVATLEDQAVKNNVSLMGGNRLVGDLAFMNDGETLVINDKATVMTLASETLATAARSMSKTNKANAKRETAEIGRNNSDIIPAPTVQIRPVELPPIPQQKTPSPETAILRPEDVPSGTPQKSDKSERAEKSKAEKANERTPPKETQANKSEAAKSEPKSESNSDSKADSKPEPKTEPKTESSSEPKSESKSEPKTTPKSEPKSEPKQPASNEIIIVETDETY